MNRLALVAIAASLSAAAGPGLAQGGSTPAVPPAGTSPPPANPPGGTQPGPPATTPPATAPVPPENVQPIEPAPVVNQPVQQAPAPPPPISIPPDAAYPNGFQDPPEFANSSRADNDREGGFPWGLLGLLGLLGLVPLLRGHGHRAAYVERDPPRRAEPRDGA